MRLNVAVHGRIFWIVTIYLTLGIIFNLGLLGYFKYAGFLVNNLNAIAGTDIDVGDIILPLAISFFTFQQIAYLVDAYKGITKEYRFSHYALFVTFFPQLIAGPIVHHKDMLPQFMRLETLKPQIENIAIGLSIFFIGLFKKAVLADGVAGYRHSAIRYVTPDQRHRGMDGELLKQREAVYEMARQRNPERWSGNTRNWNPVTEVWLNPPKENQAEKSQGLKAAWLMDATTSLTNTEVAVRELDFSEIMICSLLINVHINFVKTAILLFSDRLLGNFKEDDW
jgi:hypothetical protein